ncbi:hypothetical protein [Erythrobacter sp. JK5]|uniref:hypothetical protein n=1 Tax=Erythrobacter sp. JK5 TaxID=2829500 RepID=UPI001BAAA19D|nr:hypothetical protein [Erythrobacter sp. JK5]QUL37621.1 hypothetical protein KDC96_14950 [Erythrobacter sp. JK5]
MGKYLTKRSANNYDRATAMARQSFNFTKNSNNKEKVMDDYKNPKATKSKSRLLLIGFLMVIFAVGGLKIFG